MVTNGPRYFLFNSGAQAAATVSGERKTFGDLETRWLATLLVEPGTANQPYAERTVLRTTTYVYEAGEEVYELTAPTGEIYIMQAMSQIVDAELSEADLAGLSERLELPTGWTYDARVLDDDLIEQTDGEAVVVQDELTNT